MNIKDTKAGDVVIRHGYPVLICYNDNDIVMFFNLIDNKMYEAIDGECTTIEAKLELGHEYKL